MTAKHTTPKTAPGGGTELARLKIDFAVLKEKLDSFQAYTERECEKILKSLEKMDNEIRQSHNAEMADLRREVKSNTDSLSDKISQLSEKYHSEISSITQAFDAALKETVKNFTEQSKNYVLQVEFGTIRYIVLTLGLGFVAQLALKYFLHL